MVKNPPANAEDTGSIPGSGRLPGEGNGNSLQYSCLGNPRDRRAWQAPVHGVAKESDTTEQPNRNILSRPESWPCIEFDGILSDASRAGVSAWLLGSV